MSGSSRFSIVFNGNEGTFSSSPRHDRGPMGYEHSIVTRDGTLIEAFDGNHETWSLDANGNAVGQTMRNRVGEFDPATGQMVEVFPWNSTPSAPYGAFGVTGYDNIPYTYFDAIDSLVVMGGAAAQYQRSAPDNGMGSRWVRCNGATLPPVGRPPVWSTSPTANALFYVPQADLPYFAERAGYYNTPFAYNRQLDTGVMMGGGKQPGDGPMDYGSAYLTLFVPSQRVNPSVAARYTVINRSLGRATVNGVPYLLNNGRGSICCVGNWLYWGGGWDEAARRRYLFRADLSAVVNASNPLTAPLPVERLQDSLVPHSAAAFAIDPYANALVLFCFQGVHLYDMLFDTWTDITPQLTGYAADFAGSNGFMSWPHAGFVDTRNGVTLRKVYWFGGSNGNDFTSFATRYARARSIQITRL